MRQQNYRPTHPLQSAASILPTQVIEAGKEHPAMQKENDLTYTINGPQRQIMAMVSINGPCHYSLGASKRLAPQWLNS
jgi:hypothetical protein